MGIEQWLYKVPLMFKSMFRRRISSESSTMSFAFTRISSSSRTWLGV